MNLQKIHSFGISKEGLQLFHSDTKAQIEKLKSPLYPISDLVTHMGV